jgi:hypothetical protein
MNIGALKAEQAALDEPPMNMCSCGNFKVNRTTSLRLIFARGGDSTENCPLKIKARYYRLMGKYWD